MAHNLGDKDIQDGIKDGEIVPITDNELIKAQIENGSITTSDAIASIVKRFESSIRTQESITSFNYYDNVTDIDKKTRFMLDRNGKKRELKEKANSKLAHNYHKVLVDIDLGVMLGKNPSIKADGTDTNDTSETDKIFSTMKKDRLFPLLKTWLKYAENGGIGYVYPYIRNGRIQFKPYKSYEVYAEFDDLTGEVEVAYRIYKVYTTSGSTIYKVEVYDESSVTTYTQVQGSNRYALDTSIEINPRPHIPLVDEEGNIVGAESWGFVPMIPMFFNEEGIPSIRMYKSLIDDYNNVKSAMSDVLRDHPEDVYAVTGFNPQPDKDGNRISVDEYSKNIRETGMIFLGKDGAVSKVNTTIDTSSFKDYLQDAKSDIFTQAQSVDFTKETTGGNQSGSALEFLYSLLDTKIGNVQPLFKLAFERLLIAFNRYRDITSQELIDVEAISISFNLNKIQDYQGIINELIATNASQRTIYENSRFIDDIDQEFERVADDAERMETLTGIPPIV